MKTYNIPSDLFEEVLEILQDNQFVSAQNGEYSEEYNNDEVIEVLDKLKELKNQQDS